MRNIQGICKLVPINVFEKELILSNPITSTQLKDVINEWVQKQDDFWPLELTTNILFDSLECVYAPFWLINASASGSWSASIGRDYVRYEICSACKGTRGRHGKDIWGDPQFYECSVCNGSGQQKITYTEWVSQSGVANANIENRILSNINDTNFLKCGKRDFRGNAKVLVPPFPEDIFVLQPQNSSSDSGEKKARDLIHEDIYQNSRKSSSRLGRVRDLQIAYVNIEKAESKTWLYPIFIGKYTYDEKDHIIQVDGVTEKLYIEIPKIVRKKRIQKIAKISGVLFAIFGSFYLLFSGIDLLINFIRNQNEPTLTQVNTPSPTITPKIMNSDILEENSSENTSNIFEEDFDSYSLGTTPSGWITRGLNEIKPITVTTAKDGDNAIFFPGKQNTYSDKWLLKNDFALSAPFTLITKLNFQDSVADRAGITFAWDDDTWDRIDIQANVYHNNIEVRSIEDGTISSDIIITKLKDIKINKSVPYWLKILVKEEGENNWVIYIYWSSDGNDYDLVQTAKGMNKTSGLFGLSTAGPNFPNVLFDDIQIYK